MHLAENRLQIGFVFSVFLCLFWSYRWVFLSLFYSWSSCSISPFLFRFSSDCERGLVWFRCCIACNFRLLWPWLNVKAINRFSSWLFIGFVWNWIVLKATLDRVSIKVMMFNTFTEMWIGSNRLDFKVVNRLNFLKAFTVIVMSPSLVDGWSE